MKTGWQCGLCRPPRPGASLALICYRGAARGSPGNAQVPHRMHTRRRKLPAIPWGRRPAGTRSETRKWVWSSLRAGQPGLTQPGCGRGRTPPCCSGTTRPHGRALGGTGGQRADNGAQLSGNPPEGRQHPRVSLQSYGWCANQGHSSDCNPRCGVAHVNLQVMFVVSPQ